MCWLFHKWSKWEQFVKHYFDFTKQGEKYEYARNWQRRKCLRCNYIEEEEI